MPTVSVIGASGRQGLAQIRQLLKAGYKVRAISRRDDALSGTELANSGVEIRVADIFEPSTLPNALRGSDAVFYTHPLLARHVQDKTIGVIGEVAHDVGVGRVVWNTSSWVPDRPGDQGQYALNVEGMNALWRSGVDGTVFGSVLFMDNLLTNWARQFIVEESRFLYAHKPTLEANWISLDDVAKFMIASLERTDLVGRCFNIGGPQTLTPVMVAQALSKALGRKIEYSPVSPAEVGQLLVKAFGDTMSPEEGAAYAKGIQEFYEYNNSAPISPFKVHMDYVLDCIPLELEDFESWARRQDWHDDPNHSHPSGG